MQRLDAALEETKLAKVKDSDWSSIQKKAASQIRLALASEGKYNILSETTPIGMWKKLEEIYASKSLTNQLCLKMELYQLKMAEGINIHNHLSNFNMMSMLVGKTTLVMKDVITMLLENDKFLWEDDGAKQNNALVMEQSRGRSNGHEKGRNLDLRRIMVKCSVSIVGEANIVEENVVEVLACEECDPTVEKNNRRWILDSATTIHVCNNPSKFVSLVRGELGKITMATSEKVNIENIRDVRLNVHNGRAKILENVRYVPKCSSNIITLSELTTRGYKGVGKREWCKVYKGGRLVLHGRKNKHNIYVL
ncbi:hypothetical protein SLEP1_g21451 [Rubroshorea leprosula]|uniref:Retrovirus-related Pol polyprotein from transposon TNT 1-94-like beta-barrel domain-containing protein n=1 Tax=Rubroshorea leprosula TaxID=152421 RepID=A0AAV5JBC7_9ROSI|nr:hypothetical protein SLEP1_g21451 [Rubroshorea leprosula]